MWERKESASQFSRAFIHSRRTTNNINDDNNRRHAFLNRSVSRYPLDDNRPSAKATMAMSPSPQLSPVLGASYKMERHHTNSPPQQLSKRDKRRTLLADRLEEITRHFSQNRDIHYREQLQALQIDMNLIMEADALGKEPLPSSPGAIEALVEGNVKALRKTAAANPPPRAGKLYAAFAKEINDAIEERDAALTMHKVGGDPILGGIYLTVLQREHEVKMNELNAAHTYRMKLAAGEHRALASTLRDRLINSITSKKNRLSKDKDSLEISDSNALLLHPNQFGLTNPSSPGVHGKRATRGRRDPDDLSSFADGNKRKRKAADSDESPAPTRPRLDNDNSTPLWFSEKQRMAAQQAGAVFSIDKLFTEKELSMTYNTAALAAHTHMQRHHPFNDDIYAAPNDRSDGSTDPDGAAGENEGEDDDESVPSGAGMERQYSHATRSTRAANVAGNFITGLGIDAITDLNYPGNMAALTKQVPKLPPPLASVMQKGYIKGEGANGVQGLSADDAAAEIELIRQARLYNDRKGFGRNLDLENGGRNLLEAASAPRKYHYFVRSEDKHLLESGIRATLRESNVRGEVPTPGGEMMSRANSHLGGSPMSRQLTGEETSSRGRKRKPVAAAT